MSLRASAYRLGGYLAARQPVSAKKHQIGTYQHLPPKVDLRPWMTQVGNSCVANAFVGAYEYLAKQALGDAGDVSRLFVYYNARCQDGDDIQDRGTQMVSAIQALVEYGACTENTWPNDETLICDEPHAEAYTEAERFKIEEAEQIETDLDHWRHTLAEGYPIAFALNTFDSFDEATKNRGRLPLPKTTDNVRETHGWHAMLCVGYSDEDYYFDYEYEENEEGEGYLLTISNFSLSIYEPDEFLDELDELCEEYALDGDYDYTIDGEDDGEEEYTEEEE